MTLDLTRIATGAPPLRISELAELSGYSTPTIRKLVDLGQIETVGLTEERRIPAIEARRILVALRVISASASATG